MKRLLSICLCCMVVVLMVSCNSKKDNEAAGTDKAAAGTESTDKADNGDNAAKDQKDSGSLKEGQWPSSIYSKYGVDEISTKGKIVFTELTNEGPYQYQVDYHGVTREELNTWVDKLVAKGMRIHERDRKRVSESQYDHDTMIYFADEKQPYRMRLSFDFSKDMDFEYYVDPEKHNPAFTITERGEGDDAQFFIVYNLSISLNPLKTEQEFKGSFDSLGLKAEDLKVNENVRAVSMSEGANGGNMKISFYQDHLTTKEESIACRDLIMDKLAEKGAKFSHAMSGKEMTAAELKEANIGSYGIEYNGKKYVMMVDSDSEFNEFGGSYGVRLMLKK